VALNDLASGGRFHQQYPPPLGCGAFTAATTAGSCRAPPISCEAHHPATLRRTESAVPSLPWRARTEIAAPAGFSEDDEEEAEGGLVIFLRQQARSKGEGKADDHGEGTANCRCRR
jgi:hypothetical protein